MKPHLPRLLAAALLASFTAVPAFSSELLDDYETQVEVWDSSFLSDYTSNSTTDYVAFLLGVDIEVPSDIRLDGGNLLFTTYEEGPPVSLEFTGSDSSALTNQSSLVFDTLSGLSFTNYKDSAIYTSGNLVIQNVTDGVEDSENPDVLFTENSVSIDSYPDPHGGVIYAGGDVSITGNGDVTFTGNSVSASFSEAYGGAICAFWGSVNITENGDVTFIGNSTSSGGAICTASSSVNVTENGDVTFTGNSASSSSYSSGAAISAFGRVSITGNGDVTFTGNSVSTASPNAMGGAIDAYEGLSITGNGDVLFAGNTATNTTTSSKAYSDACSYGGAVNVGYGLSITGNGDVTFTGNSASSSAFCSSSAFSAFSSSASSYGGAVNASSVSITGNGDVTFTGNSASSSVSSSSAASSNAYSYGGAIYAYDGVSISGNGDVTFTGNSASSSASSSAASSNAYSYGGAVNASSVSITGNETVCFEKNYESANSTYRLRSIYVEGGSLNLSAKTGGHITFHDSVYNGGTTTLNADYTDADGVTQQATGTIIFSGQYTKTHLDAILEANNEGRVATDAEILNSRTSTLGDTTLYGGTLQVLDGAILETARLSVEAGSRARVLLQDAELKGTAGITFNAGTTLQVQGNSLITGDVLLLAGSSLDIDGAITINGGLTLGQGLTLSGDILADIRNLQAGQSLTLVSGLESLAVQTQELVRSVEYTTVLSGQELSAADYFSNLQGVGTLVLEYNEASGTMSITATVPEPATATLSLLALAGFCARRRRK